MTMMILIAGPYRSSTNDEPEKMHKSVYYPVDEIPIK